jgi:hypothetical protein
MSRQTPSPSYLGHSGRLLIYKSFKIWDTKPPGSSPGGIHPSISLIQLFSYDVLYPVNQIIPHVAPRANTQRNQVGLSGFEPLTPALSAQCSNQLSYRPAEHFNH